MKTLSGSSALRPNSRGDFFAGSLDHVLAELERRGPGMSGDPQLKE